MCDLKLSTRDLSLAGLLVAPIWLALGLAAGDLPMVGAAFAVAIASTLNRNPGLVAWLREVSAVRALVLLRARA
jgi:hypothetical protein